MPSPLLALLPGALKAVAKLFGGRVGEAAEALVSGTLPPEKQAELTLALQEHERALRQFDIDELKAMMSESLAMIQSEDKYVSRARPTGLYIFYAVSALLGVSMMFGAKVDPTAVLTILGPLAGVGGTYVYRRSVEKMNGSHDG